MGYDICINQSKKKKHLGPLKQVYFYVEHYFVPPEMIILLILINISRAVNTCQLFQKAEAFKVKI